MRTGVLSVCLAGTLVAAPLEQQLELKQSASALVDVSGIADGLSKFIDPTCDDGGDVRVLGVATTDAGNAEARFSEMLEYANKSLSNSGMSGVGFSRAGFHQLSDKSGLDIEQDTKDLEGTGDMRFIEVHGLRETEKADVVVLLGKYNKEQGWAARIGAGPETAFATVNIAYGGPHLLAHEVGHLLGAAHADEPTVPLSAGRGFVSESNQWRTIMGGRETASVVDRWSDKGRPHPGTGELEGDDSSHLVAVLPERFRVVSSFRCTHKK